MAQRVHTLPDGRRLVYDLRANDAPSDGAPVAFLNGLSQTTVAWGLQAQRLRGVRRVLLHDAAGQGASDLPPPAHRPAGHAQDLLHLMDALGVGQVDAVGFSYGARTALRLALAAPERVGRLVLVGCAHRETVLRRWTVQGWLDALDRGGLELCFQVVTPTVVGETWLAGAGQDRAAMLRAFRRRNTEEGLRRLLEDSLLPGGDLVDELRTLPHPALVVRGAEDLVVPRSLAEELAALLPGASLMECPAAGHTVPVEQPEWFAEKLRVFLRAD
jgi:pimeloyl-ACP methyl ester carboxylesterase